MSSVMPIISEDQLKCIDNTIDINEKLNNDKKKEEFHEVSKYWKEQTVQSIESHFATAKKDEISNGKKNYED